MSSDQVRLIFVLVIPGDVLGAGAWCYAGDKASDLYACQMGGRVGGVGEGVGEQGAGQHHHARSPRQGRLDGCDRNKALDMTDFY